MRVRSLIYLQSWIVFSLSALGEMLQFEIKLVAAFDVVENGIR